MKRNTSCHMHFLFCMYLRCHNLMKNNIRMQYTTVPPAFLCCDFEFEIHVTMENKIFRYPDNLNPFLCVFFVLLYMSFS